MKKGIHLPSAITLFRLILVPFIIYYIIQRKQSLAVVLFIIATLSDAVDGRLARMMNKTSYYGGLFDALTDSVLILGSLITAYFMDYFSLFMFIILFIPKIITFLLSVFLHDAKYKPTIFSRTSSGVLYILIILYLLRVNDIVIYSLVSLLYLLSVIHWVYLIRLRFVKKK